MYRLLLSFIAIILLYTVRVEANWYTEEHHLMGTKVTITLWEKNTDRAKSLLTESIRKIKTLELMLSPYVASSELTHVNKNAWKQPVIISSMFFEILEKASFYGDLTGGAFDITFAGVGNLYDYRNKIRPNQETLNKKLKSINYTKIVLNKQNKTVFFSDSQTQIDLGGIAKGYAVDVVVDFLMASDVEHASVTAGGDSRLVGDRRGRPWMVGIKHPRQKDKLATVLPLENIALSTSGDYERYYISPNGKRIHHIINPKTGMSASEIQSVSVIGPFSRDTDPLSTSIFVMGVERGIELINKMPEYDAVVISKSGEVLFSKGLVDPTNK